MTMRSYEDQIWREDEWFARSCLADGLEQLAAGAARCVGVPPMSPGQLADATGDYEAAGL